MREKQLLKYVWLCWCHTTYTVYRAADNHVKKKCKHTDIMKKKPDFEPNSASCLSLISYPISQNFVFYSFSPIKMITCRRRKHNMTIMIMAVKTRRESWWMRQLYPEWKIWQRGARNMLQYKEMKDKSRPLNFQRHAYTLDLKGRYQVSVPNIS